MTTAAMVFETFGSDAAVEAVLSRLAELPGDARPLWGRLNADDAAMFRAALSASGSAVAASAVGAFGVGAFNAGAEVAAVLFEALTAYALGEDDPHGLSGDTDEARGRAWSWASDIAARVASVEMV